MTGIFQTYGLDPKDYLQDRGGDMCAAEAVWTPPEDDYTGLDGTHLDVVMAAAVIPAETKDPTPEPETEAQPTNEVNQNSEVVLEYYDVDSDQETCCDDRSTTHSADGRPEWLPKNPRPTPSGVAELLTEFLESKAIDRALAEDFGLFGDVTSLSTIPADDVTTGKFVAKQDGIVSGIAVAIAVFKRLDSSLVVDFKIQDGTYVKRGTVFGEVRGNTRSILSAERVALNYMQRCSGISTATWAMVEKIRAEKSRTVLLDTRKTVPGLRFLDKFAVEHGGGRNHRMQLCDMILIKDNHVDAAGSVEKAIDRAVAYRKAKQILVPIEIETRSLEEVERVLKHGGVDRIMLDNFVTLERVALPINAPDYSRVLQAVNTSLVTKALQLRERMGCSVPFEVSGNINITSIAQVAKTNVEFVSCGALTHSVKAMDISLKFSGV